MARQFKRRYSLKIRTEDGSLKTISGLRIIFEITKTNLGYPNLAKIDLYNPNENTLSLLQKEFTKIFLEVGYGDNLRLLFTGDIRNAFQMNNGIDAIATVYAGDGDRDWKSSFFNKTFSDKVTANTVIKEVVASFKNTVAGSIQDIPNAADKLRGSVLSGSSKDIMNQLAADYGFEWSIQNNEINVVSKNSILDNNEAVLVSSATGLIGSPVITEIGADVTTLLNPLLIPNASFKIESPNAEAQLGNLFFREVTKTKAEGIYKVEEVVFKGDSKEGDWLSTAKGRSL